ncbi:EpsG family protein [Sphingobacterium faecium]|uniref:EpsG family protein n=1 Tax=Sphingobacterium faecium TaxID=34087 RepID=UPI0024790109|nr:EpsG family protein [Sphingobacterium faecium]WGQ12737.1 EpsG family protein [Sphingobacterium faecium]
MELLIILLFSAFIYIICAGIIANFLEEDPTKKKLIYWGSCIVLVLLAGFREIGWDPDSVAYLYYYNSPSIFLLAEPTFGLISNFVRYTVNNFQFVLIIYAIIGISLKYYAIEKLTNLKYLSLIVYFSNFFLLHDFTQIRAGVAAALFLIAIIPLVEKRLINFLLIISIACFFHYSALILFPLWLLSNEYMKSRWKITLYLMIPIAILLHYTKISNIITALPIDTIKYKVQAYQEAQEVASNSLNVFNMLYVFKYILFYVLLIFYDKIYLKYKYITILLKIYGISLAFYLIFWQNTILAMRVSELLGIVEILLIPLLFYVIKVKSFASFVVVAISATYLYINIFHVILVQVFK